MDFSDLDKLATLMAKYKLTTLYFKGVRLTMDPEGFKEIQKEDTKEPQFTIPADEKASQNLFGDIYALLPGKVTIKHKEQE